MTAREGIAKVTAAIGVARRMMKGITAPLCVVALGAVLGMLMLGTTEWTKLPRESTFFVVMPLVVLCLAWMVYKEMRRFFADGIPERESEERAE
ncbi:MAG: hypothetical protein ACM3SS_15335 [Rhodospirillaceae bacterium]